MWITFLRGARSVHATRPGASVEVRAPTTGLGKSGLSNAHGRARAMRHKAKKLELYIASKEALLHARLAIRTTTLP